MIALLVAGWFMCGLAAVWLGYSIKLLSKPAEVWIALLGPVVLGVWIVIVVIERIEAERSAE